MSQNNTSGKKISELPDMQISSITDEDKILVSDNIEGSANNVSKSLSFKTLSEYFYKNGVAEDGTPVDQNLCSLFTINNKILRETIANEISSLLSSIDNNSSTINDLVNTLKGTK